jgi:hypothetical protein
LGPYVNFTNISLAAFGPKSWSHLDVRQLVDGLVYGAVDPDADVAAAGTGESHVPDVLQGRFRRIRVLEDSEIRRERRSVHSDRQDPADVFFVLSSTVFFPSLTLNQSKLERFVPCERFCPCPQGVNRAYETFYVRNLQIFTLCWSVC